MRSFLLRILEDVKQGENIDLIVTTALVVIISTLSSLGIASSQLVSSITLATLGLIAIGLLVTRYRIENISRMADVANWIHCYTEKLPSLKDDLEDAEEIWMSGLILRNTMLDNFHLFKRKLGAGAKIRAMIINPEKIGMDRIAKRFSRGATPEQFRNSFEHTLNQFKEIRQSASNADNIQLRAWFRLD